MITKTEYSTLNNAYDYYNSKLFDNKLPGCLITFQRKKGAYGYFSNDRFQGRDSTMKTDEIALNPDMFDRVDKEILSTLVHEMCHLWQYHLGNSSRPGYHNREWADKMESVGLMPSDGKGKRTGQMMSHEIISGGIFEKLTDELLGNGFKLNWKSHNLMLDGKTRKRNTSKDKIKYTCPNCSINVWGKPNLNINCGDCKVKLKSEEKQDDNE